MKTSVVKSIVVMTGIFIFLSIGISFYIERDTKRFLQELGPPPILDSPSEPIAAGAKRTAVQDDRNLPIVVPRSHIRLNSDASDCVYNYPAKGRNLN